MTDRTLFILDAERRFRLAYDRRQWIIQKQRGKNWDGIWFLDRLPESFPRFRREAWLPGGKHVGWNIEDGIRACGHVSERDRALEGVQYPGIEETRLSESPDTEKAA